MARCQRMSHLPAGYIPQPKVTSASSGGSLGFHCGMVDTVPRWQLSGNYLATIWQLSGPIQSDPFSIADRMKLPLERKLSHGKT